MFQAELALARLWLPERMPQIPAAPSSTPHKSNISSRRSCRSVFPLRFFWIYTRLFNPRKSVWRWKKLLFLPRRFILHLLTPTRPLSPRSIRTGASVDVILSLLLHSHLFASVIFTPDVNCKRHMTPPPGNNQGKNDRLFVPAHLGNIWLHGGKSAGVNFQSLHLSEEGEEE